MSETAAAYDAALRFLGPRPRSEQEVRQRLVGRRFGVETVDATLVRLRAERLLDDAAFAAYWLEQRQTFKPRGARLLRAELRQRGVTADVTLEDPESAAYRAAERRAFQLRALDERAFTTRLTAFLQRRGFDWETITPVVTRLWSER